MIIFAAAGIDALIRRSIGLGRAARLRAESRSTQRARPARFEVITARRRRATATAHLARSSNSLWVSWKNHALHKIGGHQLDWEDVERTDIYASPVVGSRVIGHRSFGQIAITAAPQVTPTFLLLWETSNLWCQPLGHLPKRAAETETLQVVNRHATAP